MSISEKDFQQMLAGNPELTITNDPGRPAAIITYPAQDEGLRLVGALPAPLEQEEQQALFDWAAKMEGQRPELRMLRADPIGGYRHIQTARALRSAGAKPGFPDVFLYVPRRGPDGRIYHGLAIELKRADHSNHATPEQRRWLDALRGHGYMAVVCYGAGEAIKTIESYLEMAS